jgi:hypothetical protein
METERMLYPVAESVASSGKGEACAPALQPLLLRLEGLPATRSNRERILARIDAWNRVLDRSEAPFRLRLLEPS